MGLSLVVVCMAQSTKKTVPQCSLAGQKPGEYSQISTQLCFQDWGGNQRHLRIASPDGSVALVVEGEVGKLEENGRPIGESFPVSRDEEWIWSPDSRAVIVTTILGNSGPTGADITFVRSGPKVSNDLDKAIKQDFAVHHPRLLCSNDPNVAGLGWLGNDSTKALLVAEIQPVHCEPSDGYFEAYIVSVRDRRILRRFSMRETIHRFRKLLGPTLLNDIQLQKDEHSPSDEKE